MAIYQASMSLEDCSYWDSCNSVKDDLEKFDNDIDKVWEDMKKANLEYHNQSDYLDYSEEVELSDGSSAIIPDYNSFYAYCETLMEVE